VRVLSAQFLISATGPTAGVGWPVEGPPEIAFVGRSNVGKSSLLNALAGKGRIGRVSSTPGRTRLINFFTLEIEKAPHQIRFVDLPGYGYAKVSKEERKSWFAFVEQYLTGRRSLRAVVLLMDARRGAELDETELGSWLTARGVEVIPVATKADKLSKHERKPAGDAIKRALSRPPVIVSATTGDGIDDLWRRLAVALRPPAA
jgi:GTP-binding protein